jgi:hypothetical protein
MSDLAPGTDERTGTGQIASTDEGPPEVPESPAPPGAESEPRQGGSKRSVSTVLGREVGLVAVAAASIAIGLLGFSTAALITKLPVSYTAFRFDTTWFYRISQHGYLHRIPTSPTDYGGLRVAFFPGLPLLERVVHDVIGGGPVHTTLFVGAAGLAVSCMVLWSLVARDWDERVAWRAVILLAFFPGAYVFPLAYSEAVAIPLAIATLWALRRRSFLIAGVAAGLAGTVRLNAVVLIAVCAVAAVRQLAERDRPRGVAARAIACPVLAALGVLGYLGYLRSSTGHTFAFSIAEKLGWGDRISVWAPFHDLRLFFDSGFHGSPDVIMHGTGVIVVVVALVFVAAASMPLEYKVLGIGILASWLVTTDSGAWFRYVEFAFPVIIAAAAKIPDKVLAPVAGVCAGALAVLVILFASSTTFFP